MNIRPAVSLVTFGGTDLACCVQDFTFVFMTSVLDGLAECVLYGRVVALNKMSIHELYRQRTFA